MEGIVRDTPARSLRSLSAAELEALVLECGEKRYRAAQIALWLHHDDAADVEEMANVPKSLRSALTERGWTVEQMTEAGRQESSDGTVKWLYETWDGAHVECVLIPAEGRNSLCVSTQVGCAMKCAFCRTGRLGFKRNLSAGEILEQFVRTRRWLKENRPDAPALTNVVFMGMGEPMNNLDEVEKAVRWLHDQRSSNLARRHLTVSTSGVVPGIREFARRGIPAQLAVSLNGTNQEMRSELMPVSRRWPLPELLAAVDEYIAATGQEVTFEFVLIHGRTCTDKAAAELREIVRNRKCKVNAIALNASENEDLVPPTAAEVERFFSLMGNLRKHITLRQPRGRDILAACGQLAAKNQKANPTC